MPLTDLDRLASQLAANRQTGAFSNLPMGDIHSRADAHAVQSAALNHYADDFSGYALVGTSAVCRRSLGLKQPLFVPIPDQACFRDRCRIVLPAGIIGAQSELVFTIGAMPEDGALDRGSAANAILTCQPAIGLLGRRATHGADAELGAIADFGLHVATICGPAAATFDAEKLDLLRMTARIDGKPVITATGDAVLGHPLDALVWLAHELAQQGGQLSSGDIVATGSAGPILHVLPGQRLAVEWDMIGEASCWLD